MKTRLVEPVVCRCAGMPFARVLDFGGPVNRERLWALLDDQEFVDCLATMHPRSLLTLVSRRRKWKAGSRPSDIRRAELTLYRYLVRFCSRNDTTGSAGSTFWGKLGDNATLLEGRASKFRHIWASPRQAELLAQRGQEAPSEAERARLQEQRGLDHARLSEDIDARVKPGLSVNGPHLLRHLVHRALRDPGLHLALGPAPGRYLTEREAELQARLAEGAPATELADLLWELVHFLEEGRAVLAGTTDLRQGWVWRARFDDISRLLAEMPLEEPLKRHAQLLRAAVPSGPPKQHPLIAEAELLEEYPQEEHAVHGYDRSYFLADSTRDVQFEPGAALQGRIQKQLEAWFRLAGWQEYCRELQLRPLLRELQAQEAPLADFLALFSRLHAAQESGTYLRAETAFARQEIAYLDERQWMAQYNGYFLSLQENPHSEAFENWLKTKRLVTTLDLMLIGSPQELDAGEGQILIAEAHNGAEGLGLTTFFPQSHLDRLQPEKAREIFGDRALFLQPPVPSKQSAGILLHLQEMALAIQNPASSYPQKRAIPIEELVVKTGLRLMHRDSMHRLLTPSLTLGDIRAVGYSPSSLAAAACAKWDGFEGEGPVTRIPEVRIGDLILSRGCLRLPAALAAKVLADDPRGHLLQNVLQLPRFCFLQTGWKPMLVDFGSELAMEVLASELGKAETASFTPMQPAPEDLWLKMEGDRYTSELRVVAVSEGADFRDDEGSCGIRPD